jgi:hypothetical protein
MIVIPMAGLSKRFSDAGYDRPKYMLPLGRRTVFDHAVESFRAWFQEVPFLFIAREVADTRVFLETSCAALGIKSVAIVILDEPTAGQAETVQLGLHQAQVSGSTPVTIFNVDTFRPGFTFPTAPWWTLSDGYLEVFRGAGSNWSYVRPSDTEDFLVAETAEKRPISDLCCTGLYHFAKAKDFFSALSREREQPGQELYVAPLYNYLIAQGRRIHYEIIARDAVMFCGVPSEYEALRASVHDVPMRGNAH